MSKNQFELNSENEKIETNWRLPALNRLFRFYFHRFYQASLGEMPALLLDYLLAPSMPFTGVAVLQEVAEDWITLVSQACDVPNPPRINAGKQVWQDNAQLYGVLDGGNTRYLIVVAKQNAPFEETDITFFSQFMKLIAGSYLTKKVQKDLQQLLYISRQSETQLRQQLTSKDKFLANMSHELRTPLNAIIGNTDLLSEGVYGPVSPSQIRALATVSESSEHLLTLIDDVLDLAKLQAKPDQIEQKVVNLSEIFQATMRLIQERARRKSITLICKVDKRIKKVIADERRLKQILLNLLTNALKFTERDGQVKLEAALDKSKKWVNMMVIDTGKGIAEQDIPRLFEPFEQLEISEENQQEGTGLGLVLVKRLTEMHGGIVQVQSKLGSGTRFTISLPYDEDTIPDTASFLQPTPATKPLPEDFSPTFDKLSGVKLMPQLTSSAPIALLAEDDEDNIGVLTSFLEMSGYQIEVARNGFEAIHSALAQKPDIILMDIQMPAMDGVEATKRLQTLPQFADVPIIALTALVLAHDKERIMEAGFTDLISKPIKLADFHEKLAKYTKAVTG